MVDRRGEEEAYISMSLLFAGQINMVPTSSDHIVSLGVMLWYSNVGNVSKGKPGCRLSTIRR